MFMAQAGFPCARAPNLRTPAPERWEFAPLYKKCALKNGAKGGRAAENHEKFAPYYLKYLQ